MRKNNEDEVWRLHSTGEIEQLQKDAAILNEVFEWTKTYLARPHAQLGRSGPVCPFVPRALQLTTIWMAIARPQQPNPVEIKTMIAAYRDVFQQLEPTTGEDSLYKAILIIFPEVRTEDAPGLIDQVQRELKPFFVEQGLMIGEFHKLNVTPALHNPNFYPLRSPYPILAIRWMVESDLVFLMREIDEPARRVGFLQTFLDRFSNQLPDSRLEIARRALAESRTDAEEGSGGDA